MSYAPTPQPPQPQPPFPFPPNWPPVWPPLFPPFWWGPFAGMPENEKPYRFAREASPDAPKVGFHLGTLSWQLNGTAAIAWVIEGPAIDQMMFRIMTTTFQAKGAPIVSNYMRLSAQGSLITQLQELPYSPPHGGVTFAWNSDAGVYKSLLAEAVFSSVRSVNGRSPDGAIIRVITGSTSDVIVTATDIKHGFEEICWLAVGVGVLIGMCGGCSTTDQRPNVTVNGNNNTVIIGQPQAGGASVAANASATTPMGSAQASGGVSVGPAASSTAAVGSSSGTTK